MVLVFIRYSSLFQRVCHRRRWGVKGEEPCQKKILIKAETLAQGPVEEKTKA